MTRLIRTAALAALCALALTVTASAATKGPCWKDLINDWYDGRIDKIYPKRCYREAIKHLPRDAEIYSNARSDIERALLAAQLGKPAPPNRGGGSGTGSGNTGSGTTSGGGNTGTGTGSEPTGGEVPQSGLSGRLLDKLGPSKADSVPIPLLVLGGLALLLMAAGGAGVIARRVQEKRAGPPEA